MTDVALPVLPNYPVATMRALARNALVNTLGVKRGENVLIETWSATLPWATSAVLEARVLGARPLLVVDDEEAWWRSVEEASPANLGQVGSHEWAALKETDAVFYLHGPLDLPREEALPKAVQERIRAVDHEWFRLMEKSRIRACRWDLGRTHESVARKYGVSLDRWRKELVDAASVDPHTLQRDGQRVARALRGGQEVHITHPNGTDLRLRLAGRVPIVDDGILDEADLRADRGFTVVPSGVTLVANDEAYAEGRFVSNTSGVAFSSEREVITHGADWTFRRGRLAKYQFEQGEAEWRRVYDRLGPGKDRPGLLSVGLNPHTTSIPLLFDQERGTVSIAVGRNSQLGGKIRTPHFHGYASIRGATLTIDGQSLLSDGLLG